MSEWRAIESAPRDGTRILAWCKLRCIVDGTHRESDWITSILLWRPVYKDRPADAGDWYSPILPVASTVQPLAHEASHWMPLPPSPHSIEPKKRDKPEGD